MRYRLQALWVSIGTLSSGMVQGQTIQVDPPVVVARETDPRRFYEPHLAVHPSNPRHLLAGSMISTVVGSVPERRARNRCAAFVSQDAGITWTSHEFPYAQCWDPLVAILPDGKAIFIALAEVPGVQPRNNNWLIAMHSPDGGITWEPDVTIIGYGHDHPMVTVDYGSSRRKGWLYVTSHYTLRDGNGEPASGVFVARSRNGGRSFDPAEVLSPNRMNNLGETPGVLLDGTLLVSFVDIAPARNRRSAWLALSEDGGASFSKPFFITDECGPPPGFQLSDLAVDRSDGPFRDRMYFACRQRGGGPVLVVASSDRGATWNRPGTTAGPSAIDTLARRVMNIRVNQKGVVGALVVERTRAIDQPCLRVTFSASFDGAKTFGAREELSASRCARSVADSIAGQVFPTYGDYFGIVTLPDDSFRVLWSEMRDGRSVLLTTTIKPTGSVRP